MHFFSSYPYGHRTTKVVWLCCFWLLSLWPVFPSFPSFLGSLFSQSQEFHIDGTFWLDLKDRHGSPTSQESIRESQRFVLEEASYVFHGMIYGYRATYRPPDSFRQQEETFVIVPNNRALIKPKDLEIYHVSQAQDRFYYSVRKQLNRFESQNMQAWQQADKKNMQANHTTTFAQTEPDLASNAFNLVRMRQLILKLRKTSIENTIKKAIRNYFRRELRNKPAQIRVQVALSGVPQIVVQKGQTPGSIEIKTTVRLHIGQYQIEAYLVP